jgi:hypothetical protein
MFPPGIALAVLIFKNEMFTKQAKLRPCKFVKLTPFQTASQIALGPIPPLHKHA